MKERCVLDVAEQRSVDGVAGRQMLEVDALQRHGGRPACVVIPEPGPVEVFASVVAGKGRDLRQNSSAVCAAAIEVESNLPCLGVRVGTCAQSSN